MRNWKLSETYKPDIVIYDVLGDVVCGGFAMPIRNQYAKEVYIVTSGEMMSMYAASNISRAVNQFKSRGYAKLRGLILNAKNVEKEKELVDKLCEEIDTSVFIMYRKKFSCTRIRKHRKNCGRGFP